MIRNIHAHSVLLLMLALLSSLFVSSCSKDGDDLNPNTAPESTAFDVDTTLVVKMLLEAQNKGPVMYGFADSIAKLHGGRISAINYKGLASAIRKCWTDSCQASDLKDLVRCTISCPYDSLRAMITDLANSSKAKDMYGRYKHQEKADEGYWGDIVNLNHKTVWSEIQVKSFYMAYACCSSGELEALLGDSLIHVIHNETGKEPSLNHHYYEIIRDITGKYTDAEKQQAVKDQYEYITTFWQGYSLGTTFYSE